MKLDILAFGAHPDDVELSCSGTLLRHIYDGKKAGIVDLTRGEMGTRGSEEIRMKEANKAKEILGVAVRNNLGMEDGFFENNKANQLEIIKQIRQYRPDIVLANAIRDRHPDHGRASQLVKQACFLSGLRKVETTHDGEVQEHWRPKVVYHYIQDYYIKPDLVVDISRYWDKKQEAIMAFASQFYNPESTAPETPISKPEFLDFIKGRNLGFGRLINTSYGEGYTVDGSVGVTNLFDLI